MHRGTASTRAATASKRGRGERQLDPGASRLERRRINRLSVRYRHGDPGDVHAGAAPVPDDAGCGRCRRVTGVHRRNERVEHHVEQRGARAELQVLIRVPAQHERGREERELSRGSVHRGVVAEWRE